MGVNTTENMCVDDPDCDCHTALRRTWCDEEWDVEVYTCGIFNPLSSESKSKFSPQFMMNEIFQIRFNGMACQSLSAPQKEFAGHL